MYRDLYEDIIGSIDEDEMVSQAIPKKTSLISPRKKVSETKPKDDPTSTQKQWIQVIRNSGLNARKNFEALAQQEASRSEQKASRLREDQITEEVPEEKVSEVGEGPEKIFGPSDLIDEFEAGSESAGDLEDWDGDIPTYSGSNNQWVGPARAIAIENGIPEDLFLRLVQQESGFKPGAVSKAGAIGLAQLMPGTAEYLGVNPYNPIQNLEGGARYLKEQYQKFGNWKLALAAYNAGPGAVSKAGGVPRFAETQNYVRSILG